MSLEVIPVEEFHWRCERDSRLLYIMRDEEVNVNKCGRVNLETRFFQMSAVQGEKDRSVKSRVDLGLKTGDSE